MNKQDSSSFITIIYKPINHQQKHCECDNLINNQISQIIYKNSRDVTNGGWILQNFLFKTIQFLDHCCENNVFSLQFDWIIKAFNGTNHAG